MDTAPPAVFELPATRCLVDGEALPDTMVPGAVEFLDPGTEQQAPTLHPVDHAPQHHARKQSHGHRKHRREGGGHTRPHTKKGAWSEEEEMTLALQHREVGNKWAAISKFLPLRTDNDVKNHWNSTLRSKSAQKHNTFLWLYAKEVESVADCEEARYTSFETAMALFEQLKEQLAAAAAAEAADGSGEALDGTGALDAGNGCSVPAGFGGSSEAGPPQAPLFQLQPAQDGQPHLAPPPPQLDAVLQAPCTRTAAPRPAAASAPTSPVQTSRCMDANKCAPAATTELETEDSQCLSSDYVAMPPPAYASGAMCPLISTACHAPAVKAARSTCTAAGAELAAAAAGSHRWAAQSGCGMYSGDAGASAGDADADADADAVMLLTMPRISPAPCSLNELSGPLLQDGSGGCGGSGTEGGSSQQEACSSARDEDMSAAVHAQLQLADDCRRVMHEIAASCSPQAAGSMQQQGLRRDASGCTSNSLARTSCWGPMDRRMPAPSTGRTASGGINSASNNTCFPAGSGTASPSPPPPAVTPPGGLPGAGGASIWLLSAATNLNGSGLPPGLSGEIIAQDLQDHTFDDLDVNTFLHMRGVGAASSERTPAAPTPHSSGIGSCGTGAGRGSATPMSIPASKGVGFCGMDVDFACGNNTMQQQQQLAGVELGGSSPQDAGTLMQVESAGLQQQQQEEEEGQQEEAEEEAVRCRLLLAPTPDLTTALPACMLQLLPDVPVLPSMMPACSSAASARAAHPAQQQQQQQQARGLSPALQGMEQPPSTRSLNSSSGAVMRSGPNNVQQASPFSNYTEQAEVKHPIHLPSDLATLGRCTSSALATDTRLSWPQPGLRLQPGAPSSYPAAASSPKDVAAQLMQASCSPTAGAAAGFGLGTRDVNSSSCLQCEGSVMMTSMTDEEEELLFDAAAAAWKVEDSLQQLSSQQLMGTAGQNSGSGALVTTGAPKPPKPSANTNTIAMARNGSAPPSAGATWHASAQIQQQVSTWVASAPPPASAAVTAPAAAAGAGARAYQQAQAALSKRSWPGTYQPAYSNFKLQPSVKEEEEEEGPALGLSMTPAVAAPAADVAAAGGASCGGMVGWVPSVGLVATSRRRSSSGLLHGGASAAGGNSPMLCGGKRKSVDGFMALRADQDAAGAGGFKVQAEGTFRAATTRLPPGRRSFDVAYMRPAPSYDDSPALATVQPQLHSSPHMAGSQHGLSGCVPCTMDLQEPQVQKWRTLAPARSYGPSRSQAHGALSMLPEAAAADNLDADMMEVAAHHVSLDGAPNGDGSGLGRGGPTGGLGGTTAAPGVSGGIRRVIIHRPPAGW